MIVSAITLRIQDSLDQQIRDLAAKQKVSLSDFARTALENYAKQVQQELQLKEMIVAAQSMKQQLELDNEFDFDNTTLATESNEGWWQ
jgi:predicted transcriptional regulator